MDRSWGGAERRGVAAAAATSESITYGVLPRLLNLAAEQSCASYRPGVQPSVKQPPGPPTGQQKQRMASKIAKVSKLAAMLGRHGKSNVGTRRRQTECSLPRSGNCANGRSTQPSPNL